MIRRLPQRAALGVALALGCAFAQAATPAMPDVATDPAGAWAWLFEHGDYAKMWPAYDVLDTVGYDNASVEAEGCRTNADALRDAVAQAPVSIALRRAAMLCAEALGDDAAAERAMAPLAALSKLALSGVTDNPQGAVIRVLIHSDVYGLVHTMGLEWRYEYYESHHMARTFPFVVAAWDPQKKVERHLRFDWIDADVRMMPNTPEARFPGFRSDAVNYGVQTNVKGNISAAVDLVAWRDSRHLGDTPARVARLREGTLAGGVQSPHGWLLVCALATDKQCGDGFVDAVLPLAEKKHAMPMAMLAYAYNEGIGVPKDPVAGMRLLDAADARWDRKGASAFYANLWREARLGKVALPADIAARLQASAAAGNEWAKWEQIVDRRVREPGTLPNDAEIAVLSSKAMNGAGQGFNLLATDFTAKQKDKTLEFSRRAAEAGNPQAQAIMAWYLETGTDGVKQDDAAAQAMFVRAAHGAEAWSARQLAADALARGEYAQAWQWLRDPASNDDVTSLIWAAGMMIDGRAGPEGKPADGVALLRNLGQWGSAEANRELAQALIDGRGGMPKDLKEARRLLTIDADKGDHESEVALGNHLLHGTFGSVDEAGGTQWMERAIAGKYIGGADGLAFWLFYTKQTPEARKRAMEIWRAAMTYENVSLVANNYAWAMCTIDDPALRDGKSGLAASAKIENPNFGEIDTIAACHAAVGDFAMAKTKQQEALDTYLKWLAKQAKAEKDIQDARDAQVAELKERLALYVAGKDYRTSKQ